MLPDALSPISLSLLCNPGIRGRGGLACSLGDRKDRRATSSRSFLECPLWLAQTRAPKAGGRPRRAHSGRGPSGLRRQRPPLHVVEDADRPHPAWFPTRVTQQLRRGRLCPNCARGGVCVWSSLGYSWLMLCCGERSGTFQS